MINDIAFSGCKCPFCNTYFSKKYMFDILTFNKKKQTLQTDIRCSTIILEKGYYRNLWRKMRAIIENVEVMKDKLIDDDLNFKKLVSDDKKAINTMVFV